jgi:hypothetical protein
VGRTVAVDLVLLQVAHKGLGVGGGWRHAVDPGAVELGPAAHELRAAPAVEHAVVGQQQDGRAPGAEAQPAGAPGRRGGRVPGLAQPLRPGAAQLAVGSVSVSVPSKSARHRLTGCSPAASRRCPLRAGSRRSAGCSAARSRSAASSSASSISPCSSE